jgi:hypothetical protein
MQVVPAFLRAMFGLLDRMAGLQLALTPPSITHKYTGHAVVNYGVCGTHSYKYSMWHGKAG